MNKRSQTSLMIACLFLLVFLAWTIAICRIDVQPIGPLGSSVGFASLNRLVLEFTGVHMLLYTVTDWLGLVPILLALGFALLGLGQWISRKQLCKVDRSILVLGGFYLIVIACFVFFEYFVINYRPILIDGCLESSYPSSTTLLVMCVIPTALMQFRSRIQYPPVRWLVSFVMVAFLVCMVIGRLIAGVHWFTDICGGAFLSAGLVMLYHAFTC